MNDTSVSNKDEKRGISLNTSISNKDEKHGISQIMLASREAENLRLLFPEIIENLEKCCEPYEILVVDTKEPLDDTKDVCAQYGTGYINQEEPYFGGAYRTGIRHAKMDKFLIMDGDGSHPPKYIPDIYGKYTTGGYDVVIGSRYVDGGETEDAVSSVIMSRILNLIFRTCLGFKAKDISTDYRMYDTAQIKKVDLVCRNYDIVQEILLKMKLNNPDLNIGEIPISFKKRMYGESKRQLGKFIVTYIQTLFRLTWMRISESVRL